MGRKKSNKRGSSIIKFLVSNIDFKNTIDNYKEIDKVKQLTITKLKETNLKGWQRIFCKRRKTKLEGWYKYHYKHEGTEQTKKKTEETQIQEVVSSETNKQNESSKKDFCILLISPSF